MKKTAGIVLLIVGVLATVVGAITFFKIGSNVPPNASIIGGADGPTAVFWPVGSDCRYMEQSLAVLF